MVKLSDRLQLMADLVDDGQTVADIGTDHGFLPIYLWESGKSKKVILADISKGSLQKAMDNVAMRKYSEEILENNVLFRHGDGIKILEDGEVDAVTIAGMGGVLMTEILGANLKKTKSFKKFVLQPRNGQGKLRWWLLNNGFSIEKELLVREGKFICEILSVVASNDEVKNLPLPEDDEELNQMKYEFPESILMSNGDLATEFASNKLQTEKFILDRLEGSNNTEIEKIIQQRERVLYLEELLKKYNAY